MLNRLVFYFLYYQNINNNRFLDFSKLLIQYNIYLIKNSAKGYKAAFYIKKGPILDKVLILIQQSLKGLIKTKLDALISGTRSRQVAAI